MAFPVSREPLLSSEYNKAITALIQYTKSLSYSLEIAAIMQSEPTFQRSPLFSLQPLLDLQSILQIRWRINNLALPFEKRPLIILSAHSQFVELFVDHIHKKFFHISRRFVKAF